MANDQSKSTLPSSRGCFETADAGGAARPIWLVRQGETTDLTSLPPPHRAWLAALGFTGQAKRIVVLPAADGTPAGAVLGVGDGRAAEPCGPSEILAGLLPTVLPAGSWRLADDTPQAELAAVAWGLGSYRFRRYKSGDG